MAGRRYNPFVLQSLKRLGPRELLGVLGLVSARLVNVAGSRTLSKGEVIGILGEALEELGLRHLRNNIASGNYPLLVNDLRRLGLVAAGSPEADWPQSVEASISALARLAAEVVSYCRERGQCGSGMCSAVGGAVVVEALVRGVSAGSRGLREVVRALSRGEDVGRIAERVASETGMSVDSARSLVEKMKRLLEEARAVVMEAAERGCVPLLYVPLAVARGRGGGRSHGG